jgi:hypothetical protein
MTRYSYVCPNNHAVPVPLGDPEPPDPDPHGNMRFGVDCPHCDESMTAVMPPHGGVKVPDGWDTID